jgi:N-acetylneuraminic acid mutarotase
MGVTTGLDGRIYVLGGLATSPNETETKGARGLSTVFIYDPRTQRWSQGTPMPEGSYGLAAVTGKDGRIYAIGGASYCYDSCNTIQAVRAFTPQTNTWTTLAPLPAWRILPAAAVGTDGRIYVFGGDSLPRGWFEVYDPGKNRWTKVTGLPHVRSGGFAASAAQDGHIYLVGGCLVTHVTQSGYNNYCGDPSPVDAYDPRTNAWTSVGVTMNQRQALAAATGPDGLVYAVGGQGYGNGKLLEVIRPALRGH